MASVEMMELLSLRKMSTTLRRHVFSQVELILHGPQAPAEKDNEADLQLLISGALQHEAATLAAEKARQVAQKKAERQGNPRAVELDQAMGRVVNALPAKFAAFQADLDDDDPQMEESRIFLEELLPLGPAAITQLEFRRERDETEILLNQLKHSRWKKLVRAVGLEVTIQKLEKLLPEFSTEIDRPAGVDTVTADQIRQMRAIGHDNLAQYVVTVCAMYRQRTPEDVAMRMKLLRPVLEVNDAVGEALRRSGGGKPEDVEIGSMPGLAPSDDTPPTTM
jgi:hypothetical protein